LGQTVPVAIYLSISFETEDLRKECLDIERLSPDSLRKNPRFHLRIRGNKTQQMIHIRMIYEEVIGTGQDIETGPWIMFCDDDDTYEPDRCEKIIKEIELSQEESRKIGIKLAGLYESTFSKDHRQHRHEYWCYCVHVEMLQRFYEKLRDFPEIVENKCCDVLFAEYLRRSGPDYAFCRSVETMYHYRIEENSDSITGSIKENQHRYTRLGEPPAITSIDFAEYVVDWNESLYKNMDVYLHDVFLRTIVGCNLEYILNAEFKADSSLFSFVDSCHLDKIKEYHDRVRKACDGLFDIRFT
jgi:hypothetical protein